MEEEVKALVLQLLEILRKQTNSVYPDVNKALTSLRGYVQDTTASKSGVEDRLKKLEDMLSKKSLKKKPCTDHIQKIRKAMQVQGKATPTGSKSKEENRKPSSPASSGRTTPVPSKSKQTKTLSNPASQAPGQSVSRVQAQLIYVQPSSNESLPQTRSLQAKRDELTQTDETTELSGTIAENEEQYQDEMADEVRFFIECLNALKKLLSDDIKIPLEKIIPVPKKKIKKKVETGYRYIMNVAGDICRLKTENQYLIQTLDGLQKNIVGGDEMALSKLKTPKHIKDNQSIVEVEANVKEVTQKFHETKTEVEYVACLLKELANVSQSTNNGDNSISLSHPENIGTLRDYETKDAKNTETSRNNPMQSVQKQKLAKHYANAGHVLKQMKEKEKLCEHAGTLLTYENPSISDLSDPNRPTKLAEMYSELYDNFWTIAFENIAKKDPDISDNTIVGYLYEMLVDGYRFCKDVRQTQKSSLEDILFDPAGGIKTSQRRQKEEINTIFANYLSDVAKLSSNVSSVHMAEAFVMNEKIKDKYRKMIKLCETYIQECVQLCWLMQVQTPPLCLDLKTNQGQAFDKNCYKEYKKKGKKIAFVVWPALFLHENGPLLSRGVAQCE